MKAGGLEKPEQFVVLDDHTVRVDFLRKDRLTVPDLAVIVPCIVNSGLVQKNAFANAPGASSTPSRRRPAAAPTG